MELTGDLSGKKPECRRLFKVLKGEKLWMQNSIFSQDILQLWGWKIKTISDTQEKSWEKSVSSRTAQDVLKEVLQTERNDLETGVHGKMHQKR